MKDFVEYPNFRIDKDGNPITLIDPFEVLFHPSRFPENKDELDKDTKMKEELVDPLDKFFDEKDEMINSLSIDDVQLVDEPNLDDGLEIY